MECKNWTKTKKYQITVGDFNIKYDTVKELAYASAEIFHYHGELVRNPYDPESKEYEEFNEQRRARTLQLNGKRD